MIASPSYEDVRLPNPYACLNLQLHDGLAELRPGKRRARRAEILAAARRLIVKRRFAGFTIKELSGDCDLSTQTLHSHFGEKANILAAAINDYSLSLFRYGVVRQLAPNPISSFVAAFSQSCAEYPEFLSSIVPSTYFDKGGSLVHARTHLYGTIMLQRALGDLRRQVGAGGRADLRLAASAISALMGETLLSWACGKVATGDLRYHLGYKVELVMSGLLSAERSALFEYAGRMS